jgi:hypothetical protein
MGRLLIGDQQFPMNNPSFARALCLRPIGMKHHLESKGK